MNASEITARASLTLNRVLFGSQIVHCEDFNSQFATMSTCYLGNLAATCVLGLSIGAFLGLCDVRHPFANVRALQFIVALANVVTLFLTYIASLSWKMHEAVIERQRRANRSRGEFLTLLALSALASAFFIGALFISFGPSVLLATVGANSSLLLLSLSQRNLRIVNRGGSI